jgi:heat shock protein HtpX
LGRSLREGEAKAPMAGQSFADIQRGKWKTSLLALACVIPVYYVGAVFLTGGLALMVWHKKKHTEKSVGEVIFGNRYPGGKPGFFVTAGAIAVGLAGAQYYDARKNGARRILAMLRAVRPDPDDLYHKRFSNLVHEMGLASGLPRVNAYIAPSLAVNCMALIEADGTPAVVTSEGMLAKCSRDELQGAVAHELAHILSGDAYCVTLVCSMTSLFETIAAQGGEAAVSPGPGGDATAGGAAFLLFGPLGVMMRCLSCLVSREREYLADAKAAEMTRNPMALATAIYKAHLDYSLLGGYHMSYSPLFLVAPQSEDKANDEGWWADLWTTHPPIRKRLAAVAAMAFATEREVMRAVWESRRRAANAERPELRGSFEGEAGDEALGPRQAGFQDPKTLEIRNAAGQWEGPFSPADIVAMSHFGPSILLRDAGSGLEAPANQFRAIQQLLSAGGRAGRCPSGHGALRSIRYEGVAIRECPHCRGKCLPSRDAASKIMGRKEFGFSAALRHRAKETLDNLMVNPCRVITPEDARGQSRVCPCCGDLMTLRPFNLEYCLPIDECELCGALWFDADELEILQILFEGNLAKSAEREAPANL